ncbi:hypothetical protein F0562_007011 [Nyssa sinensis]|uniref:Apple domain-containing protein n=1 Tax=Nyssa sinensis TaxID=561372 RepID=A0A5J5A228_9ASTE|nr:hypothetical protein F0562_007011 [Nyssa sinensis]
MLPAKNSTEAVLLDNGNFVIRDVSKPSIIYWQSFDHPTDTWLPGAKLGINKLTGASQVVTSWKNSEDPAPGIFSVRIDPDERKQFVLEWNMSRKYWSSGVWNGQIFSSIPEWEALLFSNFSFVSNENETYLVYSTNRSPSLALIVLDLAGQLKVLTRFSGFLGSKILWSQPINFCGPFGIFNQNDSMFCECLQGFEPFVIKDTELNDWPGGCERKTPLQCENSTSANGKRDGFLEISNMKLPADAKAFPAKSAKWCEWGCKQNCSCTAYAYNSSGCFVWEGALLNLQLSDGNTTKQDLYLKLAASELHNGRGNRKKVRLILSVLVPLTVTISGGIIYCLCMRRLKQMGEKDSSEDLLLFDFSASTNTTDGTNTGNNMRKGGKKDIELPLFSFASVSAATANFSEANKLGEGGFGPVYKVTLNI